MWMYPEYLDSPKLLASADVGCDHEAGLSIATRRVFDPLVNDRWNRLRRNSFRKTLRAGDAEQSNKNYE
jgi:hypothetical protein